MLKVLGTRVLVKPVECKKEINGIVLPDSASKLPSKFTVVGIGDDVTEVEVGQNVIFGEYTGTEIRQDKEIYRIVDEEEILAIVD